MYVVYTSYILLIRACTHAYVREISQRNLLDIYEAMNTLLNVRRKKIMIRKVVRHANGYVKAHFVFTKDEAIEREIKFKTLAEIIKTDKPSVENPSWLLTDEDLVVECQGARTVFKKFVTVETYFGKFLVKVLPTGQTIPQILVLPCNSISKFEDDPNDKEINFSPANKVIIATFASKGLTPKEIGDILGKGGKTSVGKIRAFIRKKECREMVRDEVKSILAENGITEEYAVMRLKQLDKEAVEAKDRKTQLNVIREFFELLGTKDKNTETREIEYTEDNRLEDTKRKLLLKQKQENK